MNVRAAVESRIKNGGPFIARLSQTISDNGTDALQDCVWGDVLPQGRVAVANRCFHGNLPTFVFPLAMKKKERLSQLWYLYFKFRRFFFFFDRLVTKCYFIIIIFDCFYIALFSTISMHLLMLIQENSGD